MTAPASPSPSRWALWMPLAILGSLVALFMIGLLRPQNHDVRSAMIGKPMPEFVLQAATATLPGLAKRDLVDGRVHLVNIFASWCVPCAAEAPQLAALKAAGVDLVGVAIRDRPDDLAAFLQRNGNPFNRIGADDVSRIQFEIGSSGVPESFVVDGKGIIRYQHVGAIQTEQDIAVILRAISEAQR